MDRNLLLVAVRKWDDADYPRHIAVAYKRQQGTRGWIAEPLLELTSCPREAYSRGHKSLAASLARRLPEVFSCGSAAQAVTHSGASGKRECKRICRQTISRVRVEKEGRAFPMSRYTPVALAAHYHPRNGQTFTRAGIAEEALLDDEKVTGRNSRLCDPRKSQPFKQGPHLAAGGSTPPPAPVLWLRFVKGERTS